MPKTRQSDAYVTSSDQTLNDSQGKMLLDLARSAIKASLLNETPSPYNGDDPALNQKSGVFVTLWESNHSEDQVDLTVQEAALRGCIGHIQSSSPLYLAVQNAAISAAIKDPRFPPVEISELDKLLIEISVLSPFTIVYELQEIEIGRHGLLIEGLGRRGLLLPKVASRMQWDAGDFLHGVCQKAGFPTNTWPVEAILFRFTTTTFQEKT